eukprot:g14430.t1
MGDEHELKTEQWGGLARSLAQLGGSEKSSFTADQQTAFLGFSSGEEEEQKHNLSVTSGTPSWLAAAYPSFQRGADGSGHIFERASGYAKDAAKKAENLAERVASSGAARKSAAAGRDALERLREQVPTTGGTRKHFHRHELESSGHEAKASAKRAAGFLRNEYKDFLKNDGAQKMQNFSTAQKWTCPDPVAIQDPLVRERFDVRKLQGVYKELFLHDFSQYPACATGPTCVQSRKFLDRESPQDEQSPVLLHDTFTLACFGRPYASDLKFEVNASTPGIFTGKWSAVTGGLRIPDTVVAFKEQERPIRSKSTAAPRDEVEEVEFPDQYEWVIELQCVDLRELSSHVIPSDYAFFVGINFYAKEDTPEVRQEMLAAAKARGIDAYMYAQPWGLYEVPHPEDCWYNK